MPLNLHEAETIELYLQLSIFLYPVCMQSCAKSLRLCIILKMNSELTDKCLFGLFCCCCFFSRFNQ